MEALIAKERSDFLKQNLTEKNMFSKLQKIEKDEFPCESKEITNSELYTSKEYIRSIKKIEVGDNIKLHQALNYIIANINSDKLFLIKINGADPLMGDLIINPLNTYAFVPNRGIYSAVQAMNMNVSLLIYTVPCLTEDFDADSVDIPETELIPYVSLINTEPTEDVFKGIYKYKLPDLQLSLRDWHDNNNSAAVLVPTDYLLSNGVIYPFFGAIIHANMNSSYPIDDFLSVNAELEIVDDSDDETLLTNRYVNLCTGGLSNSLTYNLNVLQQVNKDNGYHSFVGLEEDLWCTVLGHKQNAFKELQQVVALLQEKQ